MSYGMAKVADRKVDNNDVRLIRHDYETRRMARLMIEQGKRILESVPTTSAHARRIGIHDSRVKAIARRLAYKDVP
jgi:hypothetical protein